MARPRKQINGSQVTELAALGCTAAEIAAVMDCSADTIERRFAENLIKGRQSLKIKLRRRQIRAALDGNVAMLIWLGLGQRERSYLETIDVNEALRRGA